MVKVASIQYEYVQNASKQERLEKAGKLIDQCAEAELILLPEMWNFGWHEMADSTRGSVKKLERIAEAIDGETVSYLMEKAKQTGAYIVTGTILEKRGDRFYNTLAMLNPKGEIIATFSKMHLSNYLGYLEGTLLTPGEDVVVVDTELGKIGFSVCYDLRFPELFRKMALERGAEIILMISAFAAGRTANWLTLSNARATENQCYFISCDAVGTDNDSAYLGYSQIIDYKGNVLASAEDKECIIRGELDMKGLREFREQMPHLKNHWIKLS